MWPFSKPKLELYNTLTRTVEPFVPRKWREVTVYSCGPTVYGAPHIGNMRVYIMADTLNRALRLAGYTPKHVINITDVGHLTNDSDDGADKVEVAAKQAGRSAKDITEENTQLFFKDLERLQIPLANYAFPRASEFIVEQIALVQRLEEKGYTYKTSDGIYFDTSRFPAYGRLSGQNLSEREAGSRVEMGQKKNPTDFAVWKFSDPAETRQQEWDSPWGRGFPGWHLECSAMAFDLLGEQIDIHTGGMDHIPIHHENEIAQSEAATQKHYVRTWVHGAFITINKEKVSKSLGNTITLNQLIDRGIDPQAYRLWVLQGSYRTPMNFTWDAIEAAQTTLERLRKARPQGEAGQPDKAIVAKAATYLLSNLDTPKIIALLSDVAGRKDMQPNTQAATLDALGAMLGISLTSSEKRTEKTPEEILALLVEREAARQEKRFAEADEIRARIEAAGYQVNDTEAGPSVTKV